MSDEPQFCLFAGGDFYPCGGANDFRGFGTAEELKSLYAENCEQWARDNGGRPWGHICERSTMNIISRTDGATCEVKWIDENPLPLMIVDPYIQRLGLFITTCSTDYRKVYACNQYVWDSLTDEEKAKFELAPRFEFKLSKSDIVTSNP